LNKSPKKRGFLGEIHVFAVFKRLLFGTSMPKPRGISGLFRLSGSLLNIPHGVSCFLKLRFTVARAIAHAFLLWYYTSTMFRRADFLRERLIFIAAAACVVLAVFFTGGPVLTGLDHHCTGEECPVCLRIENAQNLPKGLGSAGAAVFSGATARTAAFAHLASLFWPGLPTPIALKVKYTS
jgi:hypothetical protein